MRAPAPATTRAPRVEGWTRIADAPVAGGERPAWTGREVLSYASISGESHVIAYNPAIDRWRVAPVSPLGASRLDARTVWTGKYLIVWGGDNNDHHDYTDGAAYDPVSNRWRMIPPAPLIGRSGNVAEWTGTEMVIWGGQNGALLADGAAYNPSTDSWRSIASNPHGGDINLVSVWTGREMIVIGEHLFGYDPAANAWRQGTSPPRDGAGYIVWAGSVLYGNHGYLYDPTTDLWRATAPAPKDAGPITCPPVWSGREVILGHESLGYDPASDQWRRLPPRPEHLILFVVVWADDEFIGWGGYYPAPGRIDPNPGGAKYQPPY